MNILMAAGVPRRREAGAAGILHHLAREAAVSGHHVSCLFAEDLLESRRFSGRFADVVFAWRLARYIRANRGKFTVVNIHGPWGFVYGSLRSVSRRGDLPPFVMTLQCAEERYAHAMRREAGKGRTAHFRWKNRLWHRAYHLACYRRSIVTADHCIVANREDAAFLQLRYDRDAARVWYIPNGVDARFFVRRCHDARPTRLLFVGTWLDRKGVYYLVEAFAQVAHSFPDVRLTVAGCLVDANVVRRGFPESLRSRVDIEPFISSSDMPAVYARHDVFVLPSLVEGMPLSLLEAMASAMPVVTTATCGMADVVEHEVNGLLVKPADGTRLAASLARLIDCAELRGELGRAAQETMKRYTWDRIARQVEHVYRRAVDEPDDEPPVGT